ncbi:OmpA family protein [Thalassotalea aquiviva]|uniref:OmpA family protein n=1 Tax=Thalassotalea aquiviva TaxID=3242415 RepID=UPI00352A057F
MNKSLITSTLITALFLTGCQTTSIDPYTGEQRVNNTSRGAGIGAVVGGILGNVVGKDSKATAIGAVIGTGIGAAIGQDMDRQEQELREKLYNTGIRVERDSAGVIKLVMPSNITFATNQSDVSPQFQQTLASVSEILVRNPNTSLIVVGHTDSVGSESLNQHLSVNRANSVMNALIGHGLSPNRIKAFGKGEIAPIADNNTEYGRSLNRRVELFIEAKQQS